MATGQTEDHQLAQEANRLYWDSDRSVNQIADDLGMSKGTLYDVVEPRPAGVACPRCGREMSYPNRTARDRGFLDCPGCGFEEEEGQVEEAWAERGGRTGSGAVVVTPEAVQRARRGQESSALTRIVAGTALLGVAAGVAIAMVLREK